MAMIPEAASGCHFRLSQRDREIDDGALMTNLSLAAAGPN
jgi:hypothetical protein